MAHDPPSSEERPPSEERHTARERLRRAFLTGTALLIPLVLTLVVLQLALDLVAQAVSPVVGGFELVFGADEAPRLLLEAVTALTLIALILLVGFVAEYRSGRSHLAEGFDALMARIPGLGSVYAGTRRMSEVLLEGDTQSFQEIKLVEFPRDGVFMIGFLTAEPPGPIRESAGASDMETLFVPLAPNPVMGGFLVHLPVERVHDVDLTIEEGVQSIVTSGAAIDPRVEGADVEASTEPGDVHQLDGDRLDGDMVDTTILEGDVFPGEGRGWSDERGRGGRPRVRPRRVVEGRQRRREEAEPARDRRAWREDSQSVSL